MSAIRIISHAALFLALLAHPAAGGDGGIPLLQASAWPTMEPSRWWLFIAGLIVLLLIGRRWHRIGGRRTGSKGL